MKNIAFVVCVAAVYVLLGSTGFVHAQGTGGGGGATSGAGDVTIDGCSSQPDDGGVATNSVIIFGTFTITKDSTISASSTNLQNIGVIFYVGGLAYRKTGSDANWDYYSYTGTIYQIPSGTYTPGMSITFKAPLATLSTTLTDTADPVTVP